jgi:hypothetical protein
LEENEEDQSNIFKTPGLMQFNNAADRCFTNWNNCKLFFQEYIPGNAKPDAQRTLPKYRKVFSPPKEEGPEISSRPWIG